MTISSSMNQSQWPVSNNSGINNLTSERSEEQALPSSFVTMDGADWSTHIGSIFGDQLQRRSSSVDFSTALTEDPLAAQHNVTTSFRYGVDQQNDYISLQDVIDANHHELMLPARNDSWTTTQRLFQDVANADNSSMFFSNHEVHSAMSVDEQSDAAGKQSTPDAFEGVETADPCYARLLWTCLRDAPGHTLSLKDIYIWIRSHTQKARDPKNKGWQNSVRHNLSMNAAFERVTVNNSTGEAKKGSLWRLTEHAMQQGVISTTRYRRDPKRKPERRGQPAIKRQISGAKGGNATRHASQQRRLEQARQRFAFNAFPRRYYTSSAESTPVMYDNQSITRGHPASPYFVHSPAIMQSSASSSPYPQPPLTGECSGRGLLSNFELGYIGPTPSLFGNVDNNRFDSPSTSTDSSFYTEDNFTQSNEQH